MVLSVALTAESPNLKKELAYPQHPDVLEHSDFYTDPRILDGEGVNPDLITRYEGYRKRLQSLPDQTFPRDRQDLPYRFFEGESRQYDRINPVNNPMGILRPRVLASPASMTYHGIHASYPYPKNYAQSISERGAEDFELEHAYVGGIGAYEQLFVAVLKAANQSSFEDMVTAVEPALAKVNSFIVGERPRMSPSHWPYTKETPAGWLMHACLAALIHPSEDIRPAGRLRALALLNKYSTDELAAGLMASTSHPSWRVFDSSGAAEFIKPRIPYTLCPARLRHLGEHKDWHYEPALSKIFEPLARGDYRTTANNIFAHPREAVQLILLSFRYPEEDSVNFAIELLRNLPTIPLPIRASMFGPKATFYVDNKISNTLAEQVAQGLGAQADPTTAFEGLSTEELKELPRDQLVSLLLAAAQRLRTNEDLIAKLAAGGTHPSAGTAEAPRSAESDPLGYCAALGIDPSILQRYEQKELAIIITSAHRAMSRIWYADQVPEDDKPEWARRNAMQKLINLARDDLLDEEFRRNYGNPQG